MVVTPGVLVRDGRAGTVRARMRSAPSGRASAGCRSTRTIAAITPKKMSIIAVEASHPGQHHPPM
jgi:hypothetical protein